MSWFGMCVRDGVGYCVKSCHGLGWDGMCGMWYDMM